MIRYNGINRINRPNLDSISHNFLPNNIFLSQVLNDVQQSEIKQKIRKPKGLVGTPIRCVQFFTILECYQNSPLYVVSLQFCKIFPHAVLFHPFQYLGIAGPGNEISECLSMKHWSKSFIFIDQLHLSGIHLTVFGKYVLTKA